MKTREFFNKNQQRENPTVQRMPPPIETTEDPGPASTDLMEMLEDGQVMWAGRVETITRKKLPRAWPKENL